MRAAASVARARAPGVFSRDGVTRRAVHPRPARSEPEPARDQGAVRLWPDGSLVPSREPSVYGRTSLPASELASNRRRAIRGKRKLFQCPIRTTRRPAWLSIA